MAEAMEKRIQAALSETNRRIANLDQAINANDARELGETVILKMKNFISKGVSPVGDGIRYQGYLRSNDPNGYPSSVRNRFPDKRARPVNLRLSGDFLNDLDVKVRSNVGGYAPEVGYFTQLSGLKEQGHREAINQPPRPTLPLGVFRDWNTSIRQYIVQFYTDRISAYLGVK